MSYPFELPLLVLVPHMDDAVLACGGVLDMLPDKTQVRLVYVTDGRGTERPEDRTHRGDLQKDICFIRRAETRDALAELGIADSQITFLDHPEGQLSDHMPALMADLRKIHTDLEPATVMCPFRYDKHVDHIALNAAGRELLKAEERDVTLAQYFVYYEWKLLPGGDIRKKVREDVKRVVDISKHSRAKRASLDRFVSQCTRYYPWQHRPVLSEELLKRFARGPETFVLAKKADLDRNDLTIPGPVADVLNRLEPVLKNTKEKLREGLYALRGRTAAGDA